MNKVYEIVTQRIINALEQGEIPWRPRFSVDKGLPRNAVSKKPYRGVNLLLLWLARYQDNRFLTFKQAKEMGGEVKKGEHGWPVIFWKLQEIDETIPSTGELKQVPVLRYYTVFNVSQCSGLGLPKIIEVSEFTPIEMGERILLGYPNPPCVFYGKGCGCYRPSDDIVEMPRPETFQKNEHYYSVLFHELVHSTGHAKRLNREEIATPKKFGSEPYSREELVAELGSAFLCAECGIEQDTLEDHAAYIQGWLKRLKDDSRLIVLAAAAAQRAADHILARTFESVESSAETAAPMLVS